jgi:hypothetical protein
VLRKNSSPDFAINLLPYSRYLRLLRQKITKLFAAKDAKYAPMY